MPTLEPSHHDKESTTHWACMNRIRLEFHEEMCCACHPHDNFKCGDTVKEMEDHEHSS